MSGRLSACDREREKKFISEIPFYNLFILFITSKTVAEEEVGVENVPQFLNVLDLNQ